MLAKRILLKKKIYRVNNIQKVMKPSMAMYKKLLKLIVELFDSIKIFLLSFNLTNFDNPTLQNIFVY